jgi:hypothetical protein
VAKIGQKPLGLSYRKKSTKLQAAARFKPRRFSAGCRIEKRRDPALRQVNAGQVQKRRYFLRVKM